MVKIGSGWVLPGSGSYLPRKNRIRIRPPKKTEFGSSYLLLFSFEMKGNMIYILILKYHFGQNNVFDTSFTCTFLLFVFLFVCLCCFLNCNWFSFMDRLTLFFLLYAFIFLSGVLSGVPPDLWSGPIRSNPVRSIDWARLPLLAPIPLAPILGAHHKCMYQLYDSKK